MLVISRRLTAAPATARAGTGNRNRGEPLKVLFYGRLAATIGSELEIDAPPGCSVGELRDRLIAEHPQAEQPLRSRRALACVGNALVRDTYVLNAADRVEFLPPVSGG
jgi:molybdopterin converting factor small subunit